MTLVGSLAVLTDYWFDQFTDNSEELGLQAVYYGDQAKIPFSPTLCVEPSSKNNRLKAAMAGRRIDPLINVSVIIYFSTVTTDQQNARQSVYLAEAVESFIYVRRTAGDQVIHCYVTDVEAGYIERSGSLWRATRMNIEHQSQSVLPS